MAIYEYCCPACDTPFDVVKSMSSIDQREECPKCAAACDSACRQVTRTHFYGAKVEDASYDPAFGQVIRSSRHRKDEAKARGYIEVGNENPEVIHRHFEQQREATREQRYDDALREKVYD